MNKYSLRFAIAAGSAIIALTSQLAYAQVAHPDTRPFNPRATSNGYGPTQIEMPAASPLGIVTQRVGLATVTITYSRPGAKGRTVFGGASTLVRTGERWRTGANRTTSIKFSDDVVIEGQHVPAGEYGMYSIPNSKTWTVVLNKSLTQDADVEGFKDDQDVARFTLTPYKLATKVETFAIGFTDLSPSMVNVTMEWEQTGVKFTVTTDTDRKIMAQIEQSVLKNKAPAASDLAVAAAYYYNNKKDLNLALRWIQKANALNPGYVALNTEALILLKLKKYPEAIAVAEHSKKLALANVPPSDFADKADKLISSAQINIHLSK